MVAEHVEKMQQRDPEMNEKLGFGAYAWKQIRSMGISFIMIGAGAFIGHTVGKNMNRPMKVPQFLSKWLGETIPSRLGATYIGIAVGTVVDGLFQGYEHWVKGEASRLAVDEMNRDIAESRLRMNPELLRENALLRDMVAKQDAQLKHQPAAQVSAKDASIEPSAHAQGMNVEQGLA